MIEPSPTQYIPPDLSDPAASPAEAPPPLPPAPSPLSGTPGHRRTSGLAITALVLGICGLSVCPFVVSIPAIVFGAVAMRDIDRDPELEGKGMAQAGFITGIVGTALAVIAIIILIAIGVAFDNAVDDSDYHPGQGYGHDYNLD